MSKIIWHIKQLLPLTYWTIYSDDKGKHFVIWRMWLGRSFSIADIIIQAPNRISFWKGVVDI